MANPEPAQPNTDTLQNTMVWACANFDVYIVNLLRLFFANDPLQRFPGCRNLIYVPDIRSGLATTDTPGSLKIDLWSQWNPSRANSAPAIYVHTGDMGSQRIAVGDKHASPGTGDLSGKVYRTRVWAGSVSVWSISKLPRECRMMGLAAVDHLQGFGPEIAKLFNFARLEVRSLSAIKPLREQPTFLANCVVIEYGFYSTWSVSPAAARLNSFAVSTTA